MRGIMGGGLTPEKSPTVLSEDATAMCPEEEHVPMTVAAPLVRAWNAGSRCISQLSVST